MTDQRVTIILDGKRDTLTPESIALVFESVGKILERVDANMWQVGTPRYKWRLTLVHKGSPFECVFEAIKVAKGAPDVPVADIAIGGIQSLGRSRKLPPHFDDAALTAAARLPKVYDDSVLMMKLSAPTIERFAPSPSIVKNVGMIRNKKPEKRRAHGSIEGVLRLVSANLVDDEVRKTEFEIVQRGTGATVKCRIDPGRIKKIGAKMTDRLRVYGCIDYEGVTPVRIDVEDFRPLPHFGKAPSIQEIHRLRLNITDGEDAVDYLDRERGDVG